MHNPYKLGIDLGGTKISGIVLYEPQGQSTTEIIAHERIITPQGDYHATLQAVTKLVQRLEDIAGYTCSIGIGTPGSQSPLTGLMRNCNSTCLNGENLQADLVKQLNRPIRMANDADCLALSEAYDGAGQNHRSIFAVILGTGVGGALIFQRQIVQGPNRISGEWGHNPLPTFRANQRDGDADHRCYCGQDHCIETYLSGAGLARRYRSSVLTAHAVHERLQAGDDEALAALSEYADDLAKALASVINILDPEKIILAGGLSRIEPLYVLLQERLPDYVFSDCCLTEVVAAQHGDDSGVRGAARLWDTP